MSKAGRPKLLQKEGHHRHDGYSRWHDIDQVHRPGLHQHLQKINVVVKEEPLYSTANGPASEIYNLIISLEKMEYGKSLLFELQNAIQTLMNNRKLQEKVRPHREERNEQAALGGEDAEDREPNTYGLP